MTLPSPSSSFPSMVPANGIALDPKDKPRLHRLLSDWSDDQLRHAIAVNRDLIDAAHTNEDIGPLFRGTVLMRRILKDRMPAG
ncbi:hypothetical protein [Azospirillum doebereinerae]|uniref:Uncharacterized protein n=1 Tax=Azospirillum doebereinerae TaxID=92933 RepID=A0A433J7P4_9PROT|nr:hypothetical protein [Azospirillum doebereinerae]MCG5243240.1 hypothetical protein [Azospirillum doebereinerae]RUQ69700.1 hypothetical protein EJ913_15145 [Azospirillum doebereinerae]